MPFLQAQRKRTVSSFEHGEPAVPSNAAYFHQQREMQAINSATAGVPATGPYIAARESLKADNPAALEDSGETSEGEPRRKRAKVFKSPPSASVDAVSVLPPDNFGVIAPKQIYRCGYPEKAHFEYLKSLQLRTIVTLVDDPVPAEYVDLMRTSGIRHILAPVTPNKDKKGCRQRTEVRQVWAVLDLMTDPANYPLLVHCNAGKHRSGCVTASFRKALGADLDDVIAEYRRYAGAKARDLDVCFIRAFDEYEYLWSTTLRGQLTGPSPLDLEDAAADGLVSPLSPRATRVVRVAARSTV